MVRKSGSALILTLLSLAWPAMALSLEVPSGHMLGGSLKSPVQIEVFSDFQCSACREFYLGSIRQILQEYSSKDKVCVIYHEYPLANHKYSRVAARYTEAASRLGVRQLLAVMDSLFMDQAKWQQDGKIEASIVKALSSEDFQKLQNVLRDSSIDLAIEREISLAKRNRIHSTPTMFIRYNGKLQKAEGLVPYIVMKQYIDTIIK